MKKICLFVNLLLIVCLAGQAQGRKDSLLIKGGTIKDSAVLLNLRLLPADYYSHNIGFFCKKELQVEKAVKFPLKFRLGNIAYCDALEGKNGRHP